MAKANSIPPATQTTYGALGVRLQAIINSPKAQKAKAALLERMPSDRPEDWDQLLEEIAENENVTIAHRDDGLIQLFWTVPKED
ncbi:MULTISPECIES: DUF1654 domain-containing protein [Pseudomonas]|uniref:DUF1654 domain-containing protein n=1 Tax=unclassified Pseudomonas TaxID=196821 RepID=UPI00159FB350|nr:MULTISPECIES: DUF1654 domain-containing protein [Pseudomonas]NWC92655.1 DUF1654 domain-containing protein [Pseudomonas sp. IPO3779]NWD17369.1 DUF1654 domain-containing protein [Pseudomonas sp. IPO3778]NWE37796.1 DUF1654 domain-containing protein [Pseudomonas gingeri]